MATGRLVLKAADWNLRARCRRVLQKSDRGKYLIMHALLELLRRMLSREDFFVKELYTIELRAAR